MNSSCIVVALATLLSIAVGDLSNEKAELEYIKHQLRVILEDNRNLRTIVTDLQDKYEILIESNNDLRLKCEQNAKTYFLYEKSDRDHVGEDMQRSRHPSSEEWQRENENASWIQQGNGVNHKRHTSLLDVKNRRDSLDDASGSKRLLLSSVTTTPTPNTLVAFFVRVSGSIPHLGDNQIIPMKMVLVDTMKAYHADNGIFEAPRDGLYAFFATITAYPDSITYEIVKNGVAIAYGLSENNSKHFASATISTLIQMSTGDHVYLRIHGTSHSGAGEVIGSYSHFMGFSLN